MRKAPWPLAAFAIAATLVGAVPSVCVSCCSASSVSGSSRFQAAAGCCMPAAVIVCPVRPLVRSLAIQQAASFDEAAPAVSTAVSCLYATPAWSQRGTIARVPPPLIFGRKLSLPLLN